MLRENLAMLRENLASKEHELQSLQTTGDARYVEQGSSGGVKEEGVAEVIGSSGVEEGVTKVTGSSGVEGVAEVIGNSGGVKEEGGADLQVTTATTSLEPVGTVLFSGEELVGDQQPLESEDKGTLKAGDQETLKAKEDLKTGELQLESSGNNSSVNETTKSELEHKEEEVFRRGEVSSGAAGSNSAVVAEKDSKLEVALAQVRQLEEQLNGEREEKLRKIQQLEEELEKMKESGEHFNAFVFRVCTCELCLCMHVFFCEGDISIPISQYRLATSSEQRKV